jgi:hypothetical protein
MVTVRAGKVCARAPPNSKTVTSANGTAQRKTTFALLGFVVGAIYTQSAPKRTTNPNSSYQIL